MSSATLAHATKSSVQPNAKADLGVLVLNRPDDLFEHEAERAAEQVVSGAGRKAAWALSKVGIIAPLQRECTCGGECDDCKKEKHEVLQRETNADDAPATAPQSVHDVLRGRGNPLDHSTRSFMESRFGRDFSSVRIFNDGAAARSARAVSANAYTVGEKIVFGQSKYAPDSPSGRRLLAHELAHVVQQDRGSRSLIQRDSSDEGEQEEEKKNNSVLAQAFRAADAKRWEVAARLANGLSPYEMGVFLSQYKDPELLSYLHKGALGAPGVGDKSAIALATESSYKAVKKQEEIRYARQLAKQNGTAPPSEDGKSADSAIPPRPLTVQEKKQKCQSGETKGLMVFPLRMPHGMWRISVAPIGAVRSGNEIIVSQPLNGVYGDPMFRREVKTLPLTTFTGGVHLAPDDVVRVRVYDDNERLICVTGEQMLKLSEATDTALMISVLGTVLDAASIMAPGVGQGLSRGASLALGGATILANEGLEVARQQSMVNYGLQDHVHWGEIAFDTFLQALTLGFGGKLTDVATKKVAGVATGAYAGPALRIAVESVVQGGIAGLQVAAKTVFAQGKAVTWDSVIEDVATQFAQGALLHAITSAASHNEPRPTGGHGGGGEHTTAAEHGGPTPTHVDPSTKGTPLPEAQGTPGQKSQGAVHEPTGPPKMERESPMPAKAMRKEEALATKPVNDPEAAEPHDVIATKDGFGRCSDAPCPAISIVYKDDLAANKEFAERYKKIRALGATDVEAATAQAADLARDIEITRRNKARVPTMGGDAPTNPDRGTSKEQWKAMESKRRWGNAVDQAGDSLEGEASTSKVTGGPKSGYYIDETKVPPKPQSRLDIDADPTGPDASVPKRPGETGSQAAARVKTVIGKRISDIPELLKLWNDARASIESRRKLSASNYGDMYDATRDAFWRRVGGKTPEAAAARKILTDAGFRAIAGEETAPTLAGTDPKLKTAETKISLDHKEEKAIGDNWKKALDADNLQMEFAMPNTDRENRQARHPELRPDAKPVGSP
jgi:hypothetical protein